MNAKRKALCEEALRQADLLTSQTMQLPLRIETPRTTTEPEFDRPALSVPPTSISVDPGVNLQQLQPAARAMLRDLTIEAERRGWSVRVTSGYRDPARQAALRARWDAGDRTGLVARPALRSAHSEGLAVDLVVAPRSDVSQAQLGIYAQTRGYVWGGTFSRPDPVHFAVDRGSSSSGEDAEMAADSV